MAYADQSMSGNRITALVIVALIHVALGYALVTGLAYEGYKKVMQSVTTVDIKEEVKKEEPPPPPKKLDITAAADRRAAAEDQRHGTAAGDRNGARAPPPPPPHRHPAAAAVRAAAAAVLSPRAHRQGQSRAAGQRPTTIPRARCVKNAKASPASASPSGLTARSPIARSPVPAAIGDLDEAACANIRRRARFTPAMDGEGQPTTVSYSNRVRWVIPKD